MVTLSPCHLPLLLGRPLGAASIGVVEVAPLNKSSFRDGHTPLSEVMDLTVRVTFIVSSRFVHALERKVMKLRRLRRRR